MASGTLASAAASAGASAALFAVMWAVLVCLGPVSPAKGAPEPAPKTGTLNVDSVPMAQVFVNSEVVGLTPVKGHALLPGAYEVELRISDGRSRYEKVQVTPGAATNLRVKFGPARVGAPGTLEVTSEPWSQVFLDGRAIGNTPLEGYRAASRSYNMELRTADGRSYKRILFVEAGQTTRVDHRFKSPTDPGPTGPAGWLNVDSHPSSEVWIGGKKVGTTPLEDHDLPVGLHRVTLKAADGRTHVRELRIERLKTTQLLHRFIYKDEPEEAPRYGYLSVASNREAQVLIGGKPAGFTPLLNHALKPGRHQVTLVASKGQRRVYTVQILAGRTRTISVAFPAR